MPTCLSEPSTNRSHFKYLSLVVDPEHYAILVAGNIENDTPTFQDAGRSKLSLQLLRRAVCGFLHVPEPLNQGHFSISISRSAFSKCPKHPARLHATFTSPLLGVTYYSFLGKASQPLAWQHRSLDTVYIYSKANRRLSWPNPNPNRQPPSNPAHMS